MKHWYIWWISRVQYIDWKWVDRGLWWPQTGPKLMTDHEAWREAFNIERTNSDARAYRMVWNGSEWEYDTRLLA